MYYVRNLLLKEAFFWCQYIFLIQNFDVNLVTNADVCYRHLSTFPLVCISVKGLTEAEQSNCPFKHSYKKTSEVLLLKFSSFLHLFEINRLRMWWMLWNIAILSCKCLENETLAAQHFGTVFFSLPCEVWNFHLLFLFQTENECWIFY